MQDMVQSSGVPAFFQASGGLLVHLTPEQIAALVAAFVALAVAGLVLGVLILRAVRSSVGVNRSLNDTILLMNRERKEWIEERRLMEAERHTLQLKVHALELEVADLPALKKAQQAAQQVIDQQGAEIVKMKATHRSEVTKLQELLVAEQGARQALQERVGSLETENATLTGERALLIAKVDELEKSLVERDGRVAELTSKVEELQKRGTGPLGERAESKVEDAGETPETNPDNEERTEET